MNFKFEGSPVANKFRAAAKKAIAANRVRDSPKVSQPSGKQRTISILRILNAIRRNYVSIMLFCINDFISSCMKIILKTVISDCFEEPLPTRTLHEVFLDAADENEQMSFSTMCQLVEPCNLSTLDMSQWKVKFQHHHPEGVKADWMTFRLALGELATQMGVSFDHIVGQIICAPTTFMVNEMTAKQVAAVYGTYCDEVFIKTSTFELNRSANKILLRRILISQSYHFQNNNQTYQTGRIKPASFLRMLRHCRILDGDQKQDLGTRFDYFNI
jgi:hypothetical protein